MFQSRVVAGASVPALSLVLCSCSLISGGTAGLSSHSAAPKSPVEHSAPVVAGPQVKADNDDPPDVEAAIRRLDSMEQLLSARDFVHYARESADFQASLLFRNNLAGMKKHDAVKGRLEALDAAAWKSFGGRIAKIGEGERVLKIDDGAVEADEAMVEACQDAAHVPTTGTGEASAKVAKAVAAYDKAMARAVKLDPGALRYYGSTKHGTVDIATALLTCEVQLSAVTTQYEEEYSPEAPVEATFEVGCGMIEWFARGVRVGDNQFANYTMGFGRTNVEHVACKSLPRASKLPKNMSEAVAQFAEDINLPARDIVHIASGKPTVAVDEDDLHTYRNQQVRAYSKIFKFVKNPCGEKDVFCELGGSQAAQVYNRMEFSVERARVRAGDKPEVCTAQLKNIKAMADWFTTFHDESVASKKWVAGARYKTRKGAILTEKQLIAGFADAGKLAEDRLDARYCSKPAATDK